MWVRFPPSVPATSTGELEAMVLFATDALAASDQALQALEITSNYATSIGVAVFLATLVAFTVNRLFPSAKVPEVKFLSRDKRVIKYHRLWWNHHVLRRLREMRMASKRGDEVLALGLDAAIDGVYRILVQGKINNKEKKRLIRFYKQRLTCHGSFMRSYNQHETAVRIQKTLDKKERKNYEHRSVKVPGEAPPKTTNGKALNYKPGSEPEYTPPVRPAPKNELERILFGVEPKAA